MISLIEFFSDLRSGDSDRCRGVAGAQPSAAIARRPFRQSGHRPRGGRIRTTLRRGMARTPVRQAPSRQLPNRIWCGRYTE